MVKATVISRHNLVSWLKHFSIDKTLNTVSKHVGSVDRFQARFGDLEHDRPVRAWLGFFVLGRLTRGKLLGRERFVC